MRMNKKTLSTAILVGSALLLTAEIASAQSVVNLTAARQTTVLPNGAAVPMWGWVCGNPAATTAGGTGTAAPTGGATCTQTNGTPQTLGTSTTSTVWQPPVITVPYTAAAGVSTTGLTITLTNTLPVATSLTIVGQLPSGDVNGLGNPTREPGPRADGAHQTQNATTWTTVVTNQAPFIPPSQGNRARAFVQEAAAAGAVTYTWSALKPGTYLLETGTYPSIQGPMGLYGVLVVTTASTTAAMGTAYPAPASALTTTGVQYDADAVLLLSEIDAVQNSAVAAIFPGGVANAGFTETAKWTPACSTTGPAATANTCYPPAVDYTPTYYLINGRSFDRTNPGGSAVTPGPTTCTAVSPSVCTTTTPYFAGNVLLRFVNAGSHMHLPSVVGLPMALIAEDGNLQPDVAVGMTKPAHATCPSGIVPIAGACPKVQSDWFMAAGKVLDVLVQPAHTTAYTATVYPTFDRELSLSTNNERDGGMQAVLALNAGTRNVNAGTGVTTLSGITLATGLTATASANPDNYIVPHGATKFTGNVLANDIGIHNAANATGCPVGGSTAPQTISAGAAGTVTLNPDGSFTLAVAPGFTTGGTGTFSYCGNGSAAFTATVTFAAATVGGVPNATSDSYTSSTATLLSVSAGQGVLTNDSDPNGYPLTASPVGGSAGVPFTVGSLTVTLNANGSFIAQAGAPGTYTFKYNAVNSQGTSSATAATVTLVFPTASGLNVKVADAGTGVLIQDYKWVIEQDLTYKVDPNCQLNSGAGGAVPAGCPATPSGVPPTLGTNFHTSYMPVIASGCTGAQSCERGQSVYDNNPASPTYQQHVPAVCTAGICVPSAAGQVPASLPSAVHLAAFEPDGVTPARYYISILPGDVSNPFNVGYSGAVGTTSLGNCQTLNLNSPTTATGQQVTQCGHTMGGAPIPPPTCTTTAGVTNCVFAAGAGSAATPLVVNLQPNPLQTATLTIFVFEDDAPLNGEHDAGGNNREPGLGQFQVELWDDAGASGDATGQMEHDIFNEPLSNSLNGTIDPLTGHNACPIAPTAADSNRNPNQVALGRIVVCPQYEDDGSTPSPLVGEAVVRNLMPGRFGVIVHPSAAREAAGEEWIQTNTLDGTHFLDSFVRSGEPAYFQEFGPGGWHVFMGMANPAVINPRQAAFCNEVGGGAHCNNTVQGHVSNLHMSRAPNETLFDSAVFPAGDPRNNQAFAHTTCWASLGDRDGDTFAFTKCDANGGFTFTKVPDGNWSLTVGDQWLDLIIDGSSKPVNVTGGQTLTLDSPAFTWQTHVWTNTFMDVNGNGIQDDPVAEPGLIQVPNRVRLRNGKFNNTLLSDSSGHANFNETFPLFNWYVVESDNTRFKNTGVHTVYDAGGQIDGPGPGGNGKLGKYQGLLNSTETAALALPSALRVPGAYYCTNADCTERTAIAGFPPAGGAGGSTGRIDPGSVVAEGVQGFISQTEVLEWGKLPYLVNENGGIRGHVVYSSTRPFDDPQLLFQNLWEPLVPGVTINLYQETQAPDGSVALKLVDQTATSSWDKFAQGFRLNANGTASTTPNLNCPGQDPADPFFPYTLAGTTNYLTPAGALPNNAQFKCYDGLHNFNQVQPAPYDGLYQFPSQACSGSGTTFTATINGASVPVTCATVTNTNFGAVGAYGSPAKILPPGKYVVEVVVPPGYELVKEEDKNILMGDNFVASATIAPQISGLADIFIVPDQASINAQNPSYTGPFTAAGSPYNPSGSGGVPNQNNSQPTTDMGNSTLGAFGPGGLITMPNPCVGQLRVVPDFMSISPEGGEVAPFAGASRRLCDRKEVTLEDQMQAQTDFFVWTKTPAATHYTGFILDDFSSEFDQASPGFGEKFAVPNLPVSIKDFNGVEISRTLSDQWGLYNGLVFSTFDVNPPNPTGYSPGMMLTCMNDPGPIIDTRTACTTLPTATSPGSPAGCSTTTGQSITDPFFNPAYSTFCYENPFMPADTTYLDTPVVPVSAFAEAYNPPDCAYPDATPSIKSVTGDPGLSVNPASGSKACTSAATCSGPWVSATGARKITVTALGDVTVPNHAYSGPAATSAPFNQKFIQRHYGFGSTAGTVTVGGVALTGVTWNDTTITGILPAVTTAGPNIPLCAHQQAGPAANQGARCGELVITTSTGQQSVDTVTVVMGGKKPTFINGENAAGNAIQSVLSAPTTVPGDLIIVGAGKYNEELLMWKPVRLQGVAAASVIVDANAHPAGNLKIDNWRRTVNCLFGVSLSGALLNGDPTATPPTPPAPYDPTGTYSCNFSLSNGQAAVDPIPLEPIIGWNSNLNGNLSELLQEPTLMGAYEGAGITVLAKGLENNNTANCQALNSAGCIPLNSSTAAGGDCNASSPFFPTNYLCNPSRIDGMSFSDSSQGGGGIFLHGWTHDIEVSNNRVTNNAGTLTGGITVGQAEVPDSILGGPRCPALGGPAAGATDAAPLCIDANVNLHNNNISSNASYGDELNSTTPSSAGGVTVTPGSDNYNFSHNWVCGNLSSGDGGGFAHYGLSYDGTIAHNSFLFNQSSNPTIPTWGGGIVIQGASPDGTASENSLIDIDVAPQLSDGTGPVTIDANLIMGNTAESGSGGGLRIELANGNDILNNPGNPSHWYGISVTNNIIVNNVAGWAGGGVSIQDAVKVDFRNNTVVSNDSTASAGVLFDTLGAPNSNVPPPGCTPNTGAGCTNPIINSNFQVAGLETHAHSLNLLPAFSTAVTCPTGYPNCTQVSIPVLANDVIWGNRSFHITTAGNPAVVTLTPPLNQAGLTGTCPSGANYWDIGVYGDTGPGNQGSGYRLAPTYSILDDPADYPGGNNLGTSAANYPNFEHPYCNGSRVSPEIAAQVCSANGATGNGNANAPGCIRPGALGITVPPGVPDNNPFYENFTLTPAATVDEGNNWINMFYGPLSTVNASIQKGGTGYGALLGNYIPNPGSPAVNAVPVTQAHPALDFFGNPRPDGITVSFDIGAVEIPGGGVAVAVVYPPALSFPNQIVP